MNITPKGRADLFGFVVPAPDHPNEGRLWRENEAKGRCFEVRPASQIKALGPRFCGDDE